MGGVREEGEEKAGGGSSKNSGKLRGGEIGRNYATILNISQTTRAKSRLKGGSQKKKSGEAGI